MSGEDQFKLYIFAESEISVEVPGLGRQIIKSIVSPGLVTAHRFTTSTAREAEQETARILHEKY